MDASANANDDNSNIHVRNWQSTELGPKLNTQLSPEWEPERVSERNTKN